jgi:hypothetical protein
VSFAEIGVTVDPDTGVSPPRAASWHGQNLVKDTGSS